MYITNNKEVALIAENSGVDWIFVDLEINGKKDRQGHLDTVISRHSIEDVKVIKSVLKKSKLLVRVNPVYEGSKNEIDRIINDGADIIMLPFFKTTKEVKTFIKYVGGRVKTCLLVETPEAVKNIDDILEVNGIDYIHIGLNDLHIGYKMKFMFELIVDGTVQKLCNKFKTKGIEYGFGGIARLGQGTLLAENIISEHYRVGSNMAILSRSFCNTSNNKELAQIEEVFNEGIKEIREFEKYLENQPQEYYESNHEIINQKVREIVNRINEVK